MRTIRKRRLEAKTDYKARLELLKSGKPRLVIRKTSRYIIAQLVLSENAQDKVLKGFTSLSLVHSHRLFYIISRLSKVKSSCIPSWLHAGKIRTIKDKRSNFGYWYA